MRRSRKQQPPKQATGTKNRGGRPPFVPTEDHRRTVAICSADGMPYDRIAEVVGIAKHTLMKHFELELRAGLDIVNSKVKSRLVRDALDGNTRAQMFWLASKAGYSPQYRIENTGPNGGPLQMAITSQQLAAMPLEDLKQQLGALLSGGDADGAG